MKNTILLLTCTLVAFFTRAQIVHEHTYGNAYMPIIKLQWAGYKYLIVDTQINLYNPDHTLYKNISIPSQPNASSYKIYYISEGLFDTDSSTIEYLLVGTVGNIGLGTFNTHYVRIYNEVGSLLFSKDSAGIVMSTSNQSVEMRTSSVYNTNDGSKMLLACEGLVNGVVAYLTTEVYSLPGSLECITCITQSGFSGLSDDNSNAGFLSAAPNPANSFTRINYKIPDGAQGGNIVIYSLQGQELKRYPVNKAGEYLTLSVMDLAVGTYLYSLEVEGRQPSTKQIVVIR